MRAAAIAARPGTAGSAANPDSCPMTAMTEQADARSSGSSLAASALATASPHPARSRTLPGTRLAISAAVRGAGGCAGAAAPPDVRVTPHPVARAAKIGRRPIGRRPTTAKCAMVGDGRRTSTPGITTMTTRLRALRRAACTPEGRYGAGMSYFESQHPTLLADNVTETDHVRGLASASVTLVEYGDFSCPSCRDAYG